MSHKSKENEKSILKAKILGAFFCVILGRSTFIVSGWRLPAKTADEEFPEC